MSLHIKLRGSSFYSSLPNFLYKGVTKKNNLESVIIYKET